MRICAVLLCAMLCWPVLAQGADVPAAPAALPEAPKAPDKPETPPVKPEEKTVETPPDGCTIEKFAILSPSMKRDIKVAVVLPPEYAAKPEARYPVLYTMHGMGAPYATFSDMAPLRKTLRDRPMIVTCFDGDRAGFYIDSTQKADSKFTTFMFDEFMPYVDGHYRTNGLKGATGFSMGGYGAFHYMLTRPEAFAGISSLSGAFSMLGERSGKPNGSLVTLLGPFEENKAEYLKRGIYNRLEECVAKGVKLPPMFLACGTEDGLLEENRKFVAFLMEQNKKLKEKPAEAAPAGPDGRGTGMVLTFRYQESPGGHNWTYWRDASAAIADFHWRAFQEALAAREAAAPIK